MDVNVKMKTPKLDDELNNKTKNGSSPSAASAAATSSDDSDIEQDLVSTIHYNTTTQMAALKELMSDNGDDTYGGSGGIGGGGLNESNFFQRYFQNHSNSLPSRLAVNSRRLSQCREEDEDEDNPRREDVVNEKSNNQVPDDLSIISGSDKSLSESSSTSGSKTSVIDTVSGPTHKFVITKTKQIHENVYNNNDNNKPMSEAAKIFAERKQYRQANTVHAFPPRGDTKRPSLQSIFRSPLQSPHYDTKFFDSSLIEMKSQTSSSSTIDCSGSNEDIWVKRTENDNKRVSRV